MLLYAGNKKLKVKINGQTYQVKNDLLAEALKYVGLIEKGSKTLADIPEDLKTLVESLLE